MVVWYCLAGLIGGFIGGLGMGGGTLLIPALVIFLSISQHVAQCVNIVSFVPMSIISVIILTKQGLIKWKNVWYILIPACISAVGSSFLALNIEAPLLKTFFGVFLLVLGEIFLFSTIKKFDKKRSQINKKHRSNS